MLITFNPMIKRILRVVFMGTPGFAVPSLQFLYESGYPLVGVITAPDKVGGRGMKQIISSPVKKFAEDHGLTLLQPANLKSPAFLSSLKELKADIQVVVAFRMLPEVVWNMLPMGTLNLHGSLLPAYRGAAPIHWAIIRGEKMTGLTTFFLRHQIDTGEILLQRKMPILPDDDTGSLHDRMMIAGAGLVIATLDLLVTGDYTTKSQNEAAVSHAPKIGPDEGHIVWHNKASEVHNLIRGMSPFPGAWTMFDGSPCKIWKSKLHSDKINLKPGTIRIDGKSLIVQAGDGEIEILELQLAGKRRMNAGDFLNGYAIKDWSLT